LPLLSSLPLLSPPLLYRNSALTIDVEAPKQHPLNHPIFFPATPTLA
jgi:hypothetical protein